MAVCPSHLRGISWRRIPVARWRMLAMTLLLAKASRLVK